MLPNLSGKYGNTEFSAIGYASYGLVSGSVIGDYVKGQEFEKGALKLADKYNNNATSCLVHFVNGTFVSPWTQHGKISIKYAKNAFKYGLEISNPFLDTFFILITNFGSETFFILAITYIYWCIDKRIGIRLLFIIMTSFYVNNMVKELFHTQRPVYVEGINVVYKKSAPGYSFSSGHTQGIAIF